MTREEARNILENLSSDLWRELHPRQRDALDMAIDALQENESIARSVNEASELSREDAIEKVKDMRDFIIKYHSPNEVFVSRMNKAIKVLSARPHGEWIFRPYADYNPTMGDIVCSKCDIVYFEGVPESRIKFKLYNFCPNCGADMRKEGEAE